MADRNPTDRDAEEAVVGAILERPDLLPAVAEILEPADFYASDLRAIFEAALAVDVDGITADPVSVVAELRRRGSRVDPVRVRDLYAGAAPIPAIAVQYARAVLRSAVRRRLRDTLSAAVDDVDKDDRSPEEIAAAVSADVLDVAHDRSHGIEPLGSLISGALEVLEERSTGIADPTAIRTGFRGLDDLLGGLIRGQLVIVAARPGEGKSSFAGNVARSVAGAHGPVAYFSLEMSSFELAMRMLCTEATVGYDSVRNGHATPADWTRILGATEALVDLPLIIDDRGLVTVQQIRARSRVVPDLALVVVDYLQLMHSPTRGANRQEQVAEISRWLKLIAKELHVPVLACAQLNRDAEKRAARRPQLSDLRESGALEQDADVVILLHPDPHHPSNHDAIVAKQRNGPTGTIHLTFTRTLTRFEDRRYGD